ncbi:MAG TPA: AI-2E family transporter [Gemmataceae bacterium]|nr:AI-2E family transporter [Gemmataceae bacterium]
MGLREAVVSQPKTMSKETVVYGAAELFREDNHPSPDLNTALLAGLLLFAALAAAYAAAEVVLPIVLALVFTFLLQPMMRGLTHLHVPRALAAVLIISAVLAIFAAIGAAISTPARNWAEHLPENLPRVEARLRFLGRPIGELNEVWQRVDKTHANAGMAAAAWIPEIVFRGTQRFASGFFETILVLFFLLVSGETFLRRLVELMPRFKDKRQVVELSQQIEANISVYLVTITLMNGAVGAATAIIMWGSGVGDPILWGVVAFILNFIPIIGPTFGTGLFLFVGLLTVPSFWSALAPATLYFIVHVLEGETITPMLLARRFTLNPVVVVVSLIFWFWMWGVPGAILSVPMLAIAKIVCDGVTPLNGIGYFLEGDSRAPSKISKVAAQSEASRL